MSANKRLIYLYRWTMWNIVSRIFVGGYLKHVYRFRRTASCEPFPVPPFLVVANHGTFFDPWIAGYYSPHPFAFMCNDDAWRASIVSQWYLDAIGAFPKKKGANDYAAMKTTMTLLKRGCPVCIFPEGQTTWNGETQLLHKGIERIAKRAACPIVAIRLQGNFLVKPWWARTVRRGRILITAKVFDSRQIRDTPEEELFGRIRQSIYQNDVKDEANRAESFRGTRLAEGLENYLWICMSCAAEDTIESSGDDIRCTACGASWRLDAHCQLYPRHEVARSFPDIKDWSDWHRACVLDRIAKSGRSELLAENTGVSLQIEDGHGRFLSRARGLLRLTPQRLSFEPSAGSSEALSLPVTELQNWVIQRKSIFECAHGNREYRFHFNRKSPMKWLYYIRYLRGYAQMEKAGYIAQRNFEERQHGGGQ